MYKFSGTVNAWHHFFVARSFVFTKSLHESIDRVLHRTNEERNEFVSTNRNTIDSIATVLEELRQEIIINNQEQNKAANNNISHHLMVTNNETITKQLLNKEK
jgi:low affinity Fe/Cu permease